MRGDDDRIDAPAGGGGLNAPGDAGEPIAVLPAFDARQTGRELETELRRSEERFRIAAECSSDILFEWDLGSSQIEYFGASRPALPEARLARLTDWVQHLDPADRDDILADVQRHIESGGLFTREMRLRLGDDTWMHVIVRGKAVRDAAGRPVRFVGAATDVTEQREAEGRIRQTLNLFEAVVEGIRDPVFVKNLQGQYLLINRGGAEQFGKGPLEIIGKTNAQLFEPGDARRIEEIERRVIETGESITYEGGGPAPTSGQFLITKAPHRAADGSIIGLVGVARDITELKRLEEEYRQSQKMEAVGRLAGGIAHDFNNLLTVILGYTEELEAADAGVRREAAIEVRAAAERATQLTAQLLAFSRRQVLQARATDLNALIGDLERMLVRIVGEDVHFRTALAPDLGIVTVDPGQFQQVLLNLVVNARDAMPRGGRLLVETANVDADDAVRHQHPSLPPGRYVTIAVTDTGVGMDRETLSRVFEPFFTTKGRAGTGLGLATVYGIVKQSGGDIWVSSEPGRGTSFTIFLPRADDREPEAASGAPGTAARGGTESILLVEDEDSLRDLLATVLRRHGYRVTACANPAEALEQLRAAGGRFDLLVTDVVMPDGSGPELAEQVRRQYATVRLLFMSGYADHAALKPDALSPDAPFIQKPFTPTGLARKVREILGR